MKTILRNLLIVLFVLFVFNAKSQCTVTIIPQGDTVICAGDSVVLVAHAPSGDSLVLDQSQTVYTGGTSARTLPGYAYWQSFKAGISGTLAEIEIGFFTNINGTSYLTIWQGVGTAGTMLDSLVVNVFCGGGNCLLSFPVNIAVTAGQDYTFQIRAGPGMPDPYGLQVASPGAYSDGEMGFVDPSGTYLPGFDIVFNTYMRGQGQSSLAWSTGSTDSSIIVIEDGVYSVTATSSGCSVSASQAITVNPLPEVSVETEEDSFCMGSSPVTLIGMPAGGTFSGIYVTGSVFTPSAPGSFFIFYSYTDENNCTDSASTKIRVIECTGLNAAGDDSGVSLVHSNNQIRLEIDHLLIGAEFNLYSCNGQKISVVRLQDAKTFLEVSALASGIYFYTMEKENRVVAKGKVMIQR